MVSVGVVVLGVYVNCISGSIIREFPYQGYDKGKENNYDEEDQDGEVHKGGLRNPELGIWGKF